MRTSALLALLIVAPAVAPAQEEPTGPSTPPALSGRKLIDHHLRVKWKEMSLSPTGRADDAEYLRRVCLDLTGTIPSLEQARAYLESKDSDRREKLVDELLASEKYAEHWSRVWGGMLVGQEDDGRTNGMRLMMSLGLKPLIEKNVAYDEFVRQILTARGDMPRGGLKDMMGMGKPGRGDDQDKKDEEGTNPLVAMLVRINRSAGKETPQAVAGKFSRTFLGIQIQCAQCHDHPFDKWTQEDFYGMAGFLSQLDVRRVRIGDKDSKEYKFSVQDRALRGRQQPGLVIPDSKKGPVKPAFLESKKGVEPKEDARDAFARLLTANDNPQFAKAAVNRYWGMLLGRGFVTPVDWFTDRNLPTHPDLLDALAKDFVARGHDVKWLLKEIALSEAYQLTSKTKERSTEKEKFFAVAAVRGLSPEQIMSSLLTAGTITGDLRAVARSRDILNSVKDFRYAFSDDEGSEIVEFQGTIPGALVMMNSAAIQAATTAAVRGPGGRLAQILKDHPDPQGRVRAIFLSALSRYPTTAEAAKYLSLVAKGPAGAEDLYWVLLNSSEFLFNK